VFAQNRSVKRLTRRRERVIALNVDETQTIRQYGQLRTDPFLSPEVETLQCKEWRSIWCLDCKRHKTWFETGKQVNLKHYRETVSLKTMVSATDC
jgi:hypothetical protein